MGKKSKFYVLDLDVESIGQWHTCKIEAEGDTAQDVALTFAIKGIDAANGGDGTIAHIAVASEADGVDAEEYTFRLDIEYRYTCKGQKSLTVPPAEDDSAERCIELADPGDGVA